MLSGTGLDLEPWWNGPMWTVNCLMICYMIYPLLVRLPASGLAVTVAICFFLFPNLERWPDVAHGLVRVVPLFLLGVFISRFSQATSGETARRDAVDLSFSLYLTHYLVFQTLTSWLSHCATNTTLTALYTVEVIAVSVALAAVFEAAFRACQPGKGGRIPTPPRFGSASPNHPGVQAKSACDVETRFG